MDLNKASDKHRYVCDPNKNIECAKTICIHNPKALVGPFCSHTLRKEYEVEGEKINVDEQDELYAIQMESWFREQHVLEKQLKNQIESSSAIVSENKIQLEVHIKRIKLAKEEYVKWIEAKADRPPVE